MYPVEYTWIRKLTPLTITAIIAESRSTTRFTGTNTSAACTPSRIPGTPRARSASGSQFHSVARIACGGCPPRPNTRYAADAAATTNAAPTDINATRCTVERALIERNMN